MKCEKGIRSLDNYKKEWNERHGCWSDKPVHNFASDGADAFRYLAQSLRHAKSKAEEEEEHNRSLNLARGFLHPSQHMHQPFYWGGSGYF